MEMTAALVSKFAPKAVAGPEALAAAINRLFETVPITDENEAAEFLAQACHETAGFTKFEENMHYSPQRMAEVWPSRFAISAHSVIKVPNLIARETEGDPKKVANAAYSNRKDLGNTGGDDGWDFRGSGWFHLTGRGNFLSASMSLYGDDRLVKNPDSVRNDPEVQALTAGWYWTSRKLGALARTPGNTGKISVAINGGTLGLDKRIALASLLKTEFAADDTNVA